MGAPPPRLMACGDGGGNIALWPTSLARMALAKLSHTRYARSPGRASTALSLHGMGVGPTTWAGRTLEVQSPAHVAIHRPTSPDSKRDQFPGVLQHPEGVTSGGAQTGPSPCIPILCRTMTNRYGRGGFSGKPPTPFSPRESTSRGQWPPSQRSCRGSRLNSTIRSSPRQEGDTARGPRILVCSSLSSSQLVRRQSARRPATSTDVTGRVGQTCRSARPATASHRLSPVLDYKETKKAA